MTQLDTQAKPIADTVKSYQHLIASNSTAKLPSNLIDNEQVTEQSQSTSQISINTMVKIWKRMGQLFLHKWTTPMGSALNDDKSDLSDTAKVWRNELHKSGITTDMLQSGFDVMSKHIAKELRTGGNSWCPDVFEFCYYCKPEKYRNIPSLDDVVVMLARSDRVEGRSIADRYSHPIVLAIAKKINMYDFSRKSESSAKKMIKGHYDKFAEDGYPDFPDAAFDKPVKELERLPPDEETRKATLEKFRQEMAEIWK